MTTKIVVANGLTVDGKTFKGGDVATVSSGEARDLIQQGKARPHTAASVSAEAKKAAAPAKAEKGGK